MLLWSDEGDISSFGKGTEDKRREERELNCRDEDKKKGEKQNNFEILIPPFLYSICFLQILLGSDKVDTFQINSGQSHHK